MNLSSSWTCRILILTILPNTNFELNKSLWNPTVKRDYECYENSVKFTKKLLNFWVIFTSVSSKNMPFIYHFTLFFNRGTQYFKIVKLLKTNKVIIQFKINGTTE